MGRRTWAEFVAIRADGVVLKPANVSFEQAGAVGVAAITALQGLRDHGRLAAGQQVLVNGAGGGVGTFAVQIAKALGAEVTAATSTDNLDLVRSLGAHRPEGVGAPMAGLGERRRSGQPGHQGLDDPSS